MPKGLFLNVTSTDAPVAADDWKGTSESFGPNRSRYSALTRDTRRDPR
eukprot:CAMPEP_0170595942 /NCGR_PEP_ID=MMETSP0224-20130122/14838_1 /TAXON_ID=285029 /ORGANISM="Togula jolla, Strain CCCM 725" /LENGTH=47 /DNA_ID= /DNA_START= /DNA_END= /DNA_ORIENTATION=